MSIDAEQTIVEILSDVLVEKKRQNALLKQVVYELREMNKEVSRLGKNRYTGL